MELNSEILIVGSSRSFYSKSSEYNDAIGFSIKRRLVELGYRNVIQLSYNELNESYAEYDHGCAYLFFTGGDVMGIEGNRKLGVELMSSNLRAIIWTFEYVRTIQPRKVLYLASSCCYPTNCKMPCSLDELFVGPMELSSEPYSMARLTGIVMASAYNRQYRTNIIAAIPTNSFGPYDSTDELAAHVIMSLILRIHKAKQKNLPQVSIWGDGSPIREFIYLPDLADACIFVMDKYEGREPINLGSGVSVSIRGAAETISKVVGFTGQLVYDVTKPNGAPVKILDSSVLVGLGWKAETDFGEAVQKTYDWLLSSGELS